MAIKKYHQNNFHKHTFCIFREVTALPIVDLKLDYKSKSGSCYYFVDNGVYRVSNHWGRAANCKWRLISDSKLQVSNLNRTKIGFAKWTDFYPDNDVERLYFIEVNFENKDVTFNHKQSLNDCKEKILRNAPDTTKIIKQIRVLFEEDSWAKYFKESNVDKLRKEIIDKLVYTNASFQEIRKVYLMEEK